jgi:fatty acid synthase subunit beta
LGDKGRGEAELFDIEDVQYEEWWSKKYAPKLIKTRYVNYDRHTS